ncbi:MAG TPA: helix-turn-helix domain-containing protein [Caulobacteraceae bacterium]|nr:helix-turn-helix domain-containing protein [Caulobacteraceae bacterium]
MPDLASEALIEHWSDRFRDVPLARTVVVGLRPRADEIWRHAFELLQRESPEYRNAVDDAFTEESKAHCNELLLAITDIAAGEASRPAIDAFDFVRLHARWRARHRVPLVASLHAYRIAHRSYSELSQDALDRHGASADVVRAQRALSEFWIAFFDHVGRILADEHAVEEALTTAHETRSYARLMSDLLGGVEPSDPDLRRLWALRGARPGARLAVVVARPLSTNDRQVDREVALRSLARRLEQALPQTAFIDIRDGQVAAIVGGGDVVQALRGAGLSGRAANGQAAGVGVSREVAEISHLPHALEEALTALEFANAEQPLVRASDVRLPELLVRRADPLTRRLVPDWSRRLHAAEDRTSRELIHTIRAFADSSFNVKSTAHALGVHANTVYFRLNRLKQISGVDPRTYAGASAILTALSLLDLRPDAARV